MWNALKFRLDSYTASQVQDGTVVNLNLGLTDYATYQGSSSLGKEIANIVDSLYS